MRTLITLALLVASSAHAHAIGPALAAAAQVGPVTPGGGRAVLLLWQPVGPYKLAPAYAIHRKSGPADAPGPFALLGVAQPTADIAALELLLGAAGAAGFDLAAVETAVDALLPDGGADTSLAGKLSALIESDLPAAQAQILHDVLPGVHPPIAMALGRAYLASVPADEVSTFEIRGFDPADGSSGPVVAMLTAGPEAALVPAPGTLAERVEAGPRGHLRVHLRWCTPPALAGSAMHVSGYNLYRARRAEWLAANGEPPPPDLTREDLLEALNAGLVVQVNRAPITPPENIPCAGWMPSVDDLHFIVDDNDSAEVRRFEEGGVPFQPGEEVTYYVAALDHFRRVGEVSPGLEVVVCDRLPPLVPRQVRVENVPGYEPVSQQPSQHLAVSWTRDDPAEVSHYWIYRWDSHDAALRHAANPTVSNLLVRLPNVGAGERIEFLDDGSLQATNAPPAPTLPQDAGRTFWYTIRAEDTSVCLNPEGHANLSGPTGPAYGVLRNWAPLENVGGRLRGPCCGVEVSFVPVTQELGSRDAVPVQFVVGDPRIVWVELRDALSGDYIARYHFEDAWPSILPPLDLGDYGTFRLEARFGTRAGGISEWVPGMSIIGASPVPAQTWIASLQCAVSWPCGGAFVDPVDPGTGELTGPCGELNPVPGAVEWRIYRRADGDDAFVQVESGRFPDREWCDTGVPSVASRVCYFVQAFDRDGNPSPLVRLGCMDMLGNEGFPKPEITRAAVLPAATAPPVIVPASVEWFCPPPGVERFELAVRPPAPGASQIVWMPVPGAQEAIGADHSIHASPRVPAGFGAGGPLFAQAISILSGGQHWVRVRAIHTRPDEAGELHVAYGPWSDEVPLSHVQGIAESGPDVPWPARPVPPIHPFLQVLAEYDEQEECGRVEIGTLPRDGLQNPGTGTVGPIVRGESLEAYLTVPLPFVVYRHETSPGGRGEMTQITPLIEGFLGNPGGSPGDPLFQVTDPIVLLRRRANDPNGPVRIWIRDTQPPIRGRSYRYTVVAHSPDREIAEVRASTITSIPD